MKKFLSSCSVRTTRGFSGPILVVLLAILTLADVSFIGKSSQRHYAGHTLYTVKERPDALALWQSLGLYGRIVFYLDEHLNLDDEFLQSLNIRFASMDHLLVQPDSHNFFLLALYNGIFRKVYHVIPESLWPEISRKLSGYSFISNNGKQFRYTIEGIPIIVTRLEDLPRPAEKVVIYTHSSYIRDFSHPKIPALLEDPQLADIVLVRNDLK